MLSNLHRAFLEACDWHASLPDCPSYFDEPWVVVMDLFAGHLQREQ